MTDKNFTQKEINESLHKCTEKAERIYTDGKKLSRLRETAKTLLVNISRLPLIGKFAGDILDAADMVSDYRDGKYTAVPKQSIFALIGVLIYFTSPVDLVLDIIPVAGWLDDIAVILLAYKGGLARDLENYRRWKAENVFADYTVIDKKEEADTGGKTK